jgi:hypothetical protein
MVSAPPTAPAPFPFNAVAQDQTARVMRLMELKLRQFEGKGIQDVKAHDLADMAQACNHIAKAAKRLDTKA